MEIIESKLDYPLLKKTVDVNLTEKDEEKLEQILENIKVIIKSDYIPECLNNNICKK